MTPLFPGMEAWAMATPPATRATVPTETAATRALVTRGRRSRPFRDMRIPPTLHEERGFRLWLPARPKGDHVAWRIIASLPAHSAGRIRPSQRPLRTVTATP